MVLEFMRWSAGNATSVFRYTLHTLKTASSMSHSKPLPKQYDNHECLDHAEKESWTVDYYNPQDYHGHGQDEYEGDVCKVCDKVLSQKLLMRY